MEVSPSLSEVALSTRFCFLSILCTICALVLFKPQSGRESSLIPRYGFDRMGITFVVIYEIVYMLVDIEALSVWVVRIE